MVTLRWGQLHPELITAARHRSRASVSAPSAEPTSETCGRPEAMSASISTTWPRTPSSVTERVRASATSGHPPQVLDARTRAGCEHDADDVDPHVERGDGVLVEPAESQPPQ